jgi:hypothetical protein
MEGQGPRLNKFSTLNAYQKSMTTDDTIYVEVFLKLRRGLPRTICNINRIFQYTGTRTLSSDINSVY